MEVRLRRAATPRARPGRETDATPRPCTRARATISRPLHRQPLARPARQHWTLQAAPRTATHTLHALTHPPPAFGRRHPACRRDSKGLTHVHPVAQVKQRRTREAAAQQAQQTGDTALSEQTVHDMSQRLTVEDQAQPVRATSEQIRTLRARQHQHRRAQTQRKRAHERGPHTGPQRSWNSAELCLKPPCQMNVVNVICEYTSCNNNKKKSRRTVKSSQPRD